MRPGLVKGVEEFYLWLAVGLLLTSHLTLTVNSSLPLLLLTGMILGARKSLCQQIQALGPGLFIIAAALLLGICLSVLPGRSVKGLYDTLRGGLVFFPLAYLVSVREKDLWIRLKIGFWLAAAIFSGFFLVGLTRGPVYLQREFFHQSFGNVHTYATGLGLLFVIAIVIGFFDRQASRFQRGLCFLLALAVALASWHLISRGTVLAMGLALLAVGCLRFRALRVVVAGAGAMGLIGGAWVVLGGPLDGWLQNASAGDFTSGRLAIYAGSLSGWWSEARWFGFGINTFKFLDHGQVLAERLAMPHSIYVELLISLGLCGSLLLLVGVALVARRICISIHSLDKTVVLGFALVVYVLGRGLVDLKLWSFSFAAMLLTGAGIVMGKALTQSSELAPMQPGLLFSLNRISHE